MRGTATQYDGVRWMLDPMKSNGWMSGETAGWLVGWLVG